MPELNRSVDAGNTLGARHVLPCRWCRRATNHTVVASVAFSWDTEDHRGVELYETVECAGCNTLSLRVEESSDLDGDPVRVLKVSQYPMAFLERSPIADPEALPPLVRKLYGEVYLALGANLDALATIGIRPRRPPKLLHLWPPQTPPPELT